MYLFYIFRKDTYCKGYSLTAVNESTLMKDGIGPFLYQYFPNSSQYTSHGAEQAIKESKRRFSELDPSLKSNVRKGDYSIITNKSNHSIFVVEAKSEKCKKQSTDDMVKMARYMKDTLDCIEDDGYGQVTVCGLISSGVTCSIYAMQHNYDFIYTLYKLKCFHLPVDYHDMYRINSIFGAFESLKRIILDTTNVLSTLAFDQGDITQCKKVKTYHTPTEISKERFKKINVNTPAAQRARRRLFN